MRLKYFLRGVGIGILVTTIILTVTHSSERRMSDSEVIDRAIELGMSFSASHSGQQSSTEEASSEESSAGQENSGDDVTDDLQHESEAETEMGSQSPSETASELAGDGEALPGKESEAVTGMTTQATTETTETTTTAASGKITPKESVRVRASASEDGEYLGTIYLGETYTLYENANGWCKIDYNGKTGYVKSDFVDIQ